MTSLGLRVRGDSFWSRSKYTVHSEGMDLAADNFPCRLSWSCKVIHLTRQSHYWGSQLAAYSRRNIHLWWGIRQYRERTGSWSHFVQVCQDSGVLKTRKDRGRVIRTEFMRSFHNSNMCPDAKMGAKLLQAFLLRWHLHAGTEVYYPGWMKATDVALSVTKVGGMTRMPMQGI